MSTLFTKRRPVSIFFALAISLTLLAVLLGCNDNTTPTGTAESTSNLVSSPSPTPRPTLITSATPVAGAFTNVSSTSGLVTGSGTASNQIPTQTPTQPALGLSGIEWKVTSYLDGAAKRDATLKASIKFEVDGSFKGRDGCGGTVLGKYQAGDKATIMIRDIQIADIACPSNSAYAENSDFMNGIKAARNYEINGTILTLRDTNGADLLVFRGS